MLVQVVVFVDGAAHLLLAIVDGGNGQGIERRLLRLAPQHVGMLQPPVAEGDDDVVKLQPLALVDGQDAYAVALGTLDGLGTDGLLPFADKSVDVGGVVLCKLVQLVVEGADVGALLMETVEVEDLIEVLCQLDRKSVV